MILGCQNRILWTEWLKQPTFLSYSSGSWEVHEQGVGRTGVWCEPFSWLPVLQYTQVAERDRSLVFHLIRALIIFTRVPPPLSNYLSKTYRLTPSHWGVGFQHRSFGEHEHSAHNILTIFECTHQYVKYVDEVVQPSSPSVSLTLFILQNRNSAPI